MRLETSWTQREKSRDQRHTGRVATSIGTREQHTPAAAVWRGKQVVVVYIMNRVNCSGSTSTSSRSTTDHHIISSISRNGRDGSGRDERVMYSSSRPCRREDRGGNEDDERYVRKEGDGRRKRRPRSRSRSFDAGGSRHRSPRYNDRDNADNYYCKDSLRRQDERRRRTDPEKPTAAIRMTGLSTSTTQQMVIFLFHSPSLRDARDALL